MSDAYSIPATRLLKGLGILGRLLQQEQSVVGLRRALVANGFTDSEITLLFDTLRQERIRGLRVKIRTEGRTHFWSLEGVTFHI